MNINVATWGRLLKRSSSPTAPQPLPQQFDELHPCKFQLEKAVVIAFFIKNLLCDHLDTEQ